LATITVILDEVTIPGMDTVVEVITAAMDTVVVGN
jgi:hypothetical protein